MSTQLYFYSFEAWNQQLADIRQAKQSLFLEHYIYQTDRIGHRYGTLLAAKARQGLDVRVLVDAFGSHALRSSPLRRVMESAGVRFTFFNPPRFWWLWNKPHLLNRDHRKLLLIDGSLAHLGGPGMEDRMRDWRDTDFRTTDKNVVAHATAEFMVLWDAPSPTAYHPRNTVGDHTYLVANGYRDHERFVHDELVTQLQSARRRIYLTTPYFFPTEDIQRALIDAARRGVDVWLIAPRRSDHRSGDIITATYSESLLAAGARVFLRHAPFLHAKTAVIDDWATIGSANFDHLSLAHTLELNVCTRELRTVALLLRQFQADREQSSEITLHAWRQRPWQHRFLGKLGQLVWQIF